MRIGIFFGGNSREREVSFAGGRTVYDNLDKNLFEAVPIFVDSFNNFILLDWHCIYKGSIRDFYPPVSALKKSKHAIQIYAENIKNAYNDNGKSLIKNIGKILSHEELKTKIDFAFLALHGNFGEDGTIQGLLEWIGIPYSGSGIIPSSLGMNKSLQKKLMRAAGMNVPKTFSISKQNWQQGDRKKIHNKVKKLFNKSCVLKPANQGSSVGVSVIDLANFSLFEKAVDKTFFIQTVVKKNWTGKNYSQKILFIQSICDIKEGIGLPCLSNDETIYNPDELFELFEVNFISNKSKANSIKLESIFSETECLIEDFIEGREFSCIVILNDDGMPVSLPPTEIVKGSEIFDYRSKYLPGLSRKITPIALPEKDIEQIRKECVNLFSFFNFHVYARIDGFINKAGKIFLNDPNTTSGMMPSSFFFHQAAEIGLNPSQFLTYIIRTSIAERIASFSIQQPLVKLLKKLDEKIKQNKKQKSNKKNVAVLMGGYTTERHISVESGRNIYEKLASSTKYNPFPVFVTGNAEQHNFYLLPINIMLKDNADDIREKVLHFKRSPIIDKIAKECSELLKKYGNDKAINTPRKITYNELKKNADAVFIALHGRPGEDGTVQKEFDKMKIPYNGSGVDSSRITINKFDTNELLKSHGFLVAEHLLIQKGEWEKNKNAVLKKVEKISYPIIAKPADDGCSSAVKKIKTQNDFVNYAEAVFRKSMNVSPELSKKLNLKPKEEFPQKKYFLVEKFIEKGNAKHFLEITGGLLTHYKKNKIEFEMFEPSETLAEGEILSLEEKFLAGQGQNLTPSRFSENATSQKEISKTVRKELERAAKVLKVQGYCRIDAFVRIYEKNKIEVIFIEVNSLPGMTPATAIFHQCALNGYKPYEFIDSILEFGKQRNLA